MSSARNGDENRESIQLTSEWVTAFTSEAVQQLGKAVAALHALERKSEKRAPLDVAFRALHSVRGSCGFFGLGELESLAHRTEAVLGELLQTQAQPDAETIESLLHSVERLRTAIQELCERESRIG